MHPPMQSFSITCTQLNNCLETPLPQEEGEGEKKALEDGSGEEEKGDAADEERVSCFVCVLKEDKGYCLRSQDTH